MMRCHRFFRESSRCQVQAPRTFSTCRRRVGPALAGRAGSGGGSGPRAARGECIMRSQIFARSSSTRNAQLPPSPFSTTSVRGDGARGCSGSDRRRTRRSSRFCRSSSAASQPVAPRWTTTGGATGTWIDGSSAAGSFAGGSASVRGCGRRRAGADRGRGRGGDARARPPSSAGRCGGT